MTVEDLRFKEIEHKFVVDARFDLARFRAALQAMHPTNTTNVQVRDRYYLTADGRERGYVIRHRYDPELHHLTLKTIEIDTEVRVEINIDLGHHAGDQQAAVDRFISHLGVQWTGSLHKNLEAWYFPDSEVVYHEASTESRSVLCVEFEAKGQQSLGDARATLHRYERATGFDTAARSTRPLLTILFPEIMEQLNSADDRLR